MPSPELTTKLLFGMLESLFPKGIFDKQEMASLVERTLIHPPEKEASPQPSLQAKEREIRNLSQTSKNEEANSSKLTGKSLTSATGSQPFPSSQRVDLIADQAILTRSIRAVLQAMLKETKTENIEGTVRELIQALGKSEFSSRFGHPPSYDFTAKKTEKEERKPLPFVKTPNTKGKEESLIEKHTVLSSQTTSRAPFEPQPKEPIAQTKNTLLSGSTERPREKTEPEKRASLSAPTEKKEESISRNRESKLIVPPEKEGPDGLPGQKRPQEALLLKNSPPVTPSETPTPNAPFFHPKNAGPLPPLVQNSAENNPNPLLTVGPFVVSPLSAPPFLKQKKKEREKDDEEEESDPDKDS